MFEKFRRDERYIVLKDGYNKKLIVGVFLAVVIIITFATSKIWLPDSRAKMHRGLGSELTYNLYKVKFEKNVYYDENEHLIEVLLTEEIMTDKKEMKLTYIPYASDEYELPYEVISGYKSNKDDSEVIKEQSKMIRIRVPDDFYYVRIDIHQENTITQSIYIDYRECKSVDMNEKGKDYLKMLEDKQKEIDDYKAQLQTVEDSIATKQESIDKINALSKEEQKKQQTQLDKLKDEIETIKESKKVLENDIKDAEKVLKDLRGYQDEKEV
ncbi:coiled-coil domain-containing protein [Breznakia pachnodae]|uniref:Uncharacterized membrane protein YgaE (UPF0421/DUF939 family) n=1 Tax=Breznakia pachnodae TaxID=265178 RepID=A0ABU0DZB5_9FIRM|nr:hypothetical protein [Breznakia pachnodae]MDQ0359979.1 uncharacterized membrane protein YgaE (UPF0421/DUF939 family) [Breznakia pachnodae]